MPKGLLIFLAVAALIAVLGFIGLPWLKTALLGESRQVRYKVTMAVDDYEVLTAKNQTVSRTVVGLELYFPMGGAPESPKDIEVVGDEGRVIQADWSRPEREDLPDQGVTRWVIKEIFLPLGFRQGLLRTTKYNKELCYIKLPPVPYNAP